MSQLLLFCINKSNKTKNHIISFNWLKLKHKIAVILVWIKTWSKREAPHLCRMVLTFWTMHVSILLLLQHGKLSHHEHIALRCRKSKEGFPPRILTRKHSLWISRIRIMLQKYSLLKLLMFIASQSCTAHHQNIYQFWLSSYLQPWKSLCKYAQKIYIHASSVIYQCGFKTFFGRRYPLKNFHPNEKVFENWVCPLQSINFPTATLPQPSILQRVPPPCRREDTETKIEKQTLRMRK